MAPKLGKVVVFVAGIGATLAVQLVVRAIRAETPAVETDGDDTADAAATTSPDESYESQDDVSEEPRTAPPRAKVKAVPKTSAAKPKAAVVKVAAGAPEVRIRNAFRTRTFWTEQPLTQSGLGFDVVVDMSGKSAPGWKPFLEWSAGGKGKRTLWGVPAQSPQILHLPFAAALGPKPAGALPEVTVSLRASVAPADGTAGGKVPSDKMAVTLRSLRGAAKQGFKVVIGAPAGAPQKGAWFTSWGKVTESTAAQVYYVAHGSDLLKLAPALRLAGDFLVQATTAPAQAGVTLIGQGRVVGSVLRGSDAEVAALSKLLGASFAFRGPAAAYVGELSATPQALAERLGSVGGESVYVYGPNQAKPFFPVKKSLLISSPEVLTMLKQNGTTLFAQPVEVVSALAH